MKGRSGFTLVELLLVTIIIGLMGSVSVMNFKGMQDTSNNATASNNLKEVAMALERYRSDRGQLPRTGLTGLDGVGTTFLVGGSNAPGSGNGSQYLPGNRLPLSPWAPPKFPQTGADVPFPATIPVNGVAAATGVKVSQNIGTVVATPGTFPKTVTYLQSDYGLIQYSTNGGLQPDIYSIVAIGKKGSRALVVDARSNAN